MKAWILHGIDEIYFEETEKPIPKEGEVLVHVKTAGICGSDIPRIYQTGAHTHPLILGHEFSGIVEEIGDGTKEEWLGKRVAVFPLLPCGECVACKKKQYEMCRNYSYLGSRRNGGFAEYVTVPQKNLLLLSENVSYEAAAMLEPMAVAVHAMRRVKPLDSQTVLIYGLGTIGLLLLMFLKEAGVEHILAVGNKEAQKKACLEIGLREECFCDSRKQNVEHWVMEHTDGIGAEVLFECVGRNETISDAIRLAASAGEIVLLGNPDSDMLLEKMVYWNILRNQLTVSGTWNSSFTGDLQDDWHYVLERLEKKRITPEKLISHKFSLEELERGFHIMRDKKEDYVKIMCIIE